MVFDKSPLYYVESNLTGKRYSLYDLAKWKNGLAFKKIDFSEDGGIPVIKIAELNNGIGSTTAYAKGEYDKDVYLEFGDYLFSWSGNPQTSIDIFRFQLKNGWLNQHIFKVTPNDSIIYKEFFFYVMKWLKPIFTDIAINKQTTGLGHVTISDLKRLSVILPSYELQHKIGDLLLSIDRKIALNTSINENLEQQAQAIFKSWFVDFEPFGGIMPDDWMVTTFDSICDFKNGYAFKSKELLNNPDSDCYEVFKQGHILKGGGFNAFGTKGWFPKNKCEKLAKFVLKRNDILMAMTDMKGNVAILGNTAILPEDNRYILNQRVGLLRPKTQTGISPAYIYLLTNSNDFLFDLRSRANSGVQVNLSADAIRNSEVVLASKDICRKFSEIVDPLIEKTLDNQIENQRLTALRDALLPKLMNGEIDVSQVKI